MTISADDIGNDRGVMQEAVGVDGRLWGKLGADGGGRYPLICHLLDTSAAALVLWDTWLRPGLRELITAAVAPDEVTARAVFSAIAGLHDVGKANKIFQGQLYSKHADAAVHGIVAELCSAGFDVTTPLSAVPGRSVPPVYKTVMRRHEAVSLFTQTGVWPRGSDPVADTWASVIVGGHHGRFHPRFDPATKAADCLTANGFLTGLTAGKWGTQQQAHEAAVLKACGVTRAQLDAPVHGEKTTAAILLLTGMVMLADWLASGTESLAHGQGLATDPVADPTAWLNGRRTEFFEQSVPQTLGLYEDLADPLTAIMGAFADSPSPLQAVAPTIGRGLWIATETTGSGKTEAAMLRHAAVPGEGILFALPTRATTDAMFERIAGYYSSSTNAAALLHTHRSLNSFYTNVSHPGEGLHSTPWLADARNALFAPVSVGTCDQVLLGALRQKNTPVRLLALANRHIVIDEVHSFDHYQAALLEELLAWWGETDTRVTLLSASLPSAVALRYAQSYGGPSVNVTPDYPGHIRVTASGATSAPVTSQRSYSLRVNLHEAPATALVDAHFERALQYRQRSADTRIAIVVNQVQRALDIARRLTEAGERVIVLHSRMAAGHRAAVTRELHEVAGKASGQRGVIVVGTQIIESSLDLDFDHMLTDLAPAPALIQRAGRLWRSTAVIDGVWAAHQFPRPTVLPTLDVVIPTDISGALDARASLPYLPGELRRTADALRRDVRDGCVIAIPADVQPLVDAAAFDPRSPDLEGVDGELELIAAARKLQAADTVVVSFHHDHPDGTILGHDTTLRELSAVTEPDELAEYSTRHIERPTVDCFIVEPEGSSKWVWRASVEAALYSRNPHVVRAVLALTFPVSKSNISAKTGIEAIPGFDLEDEIGMRKRGPMQRQLMPVRLVDGAVYDDLLGVRFR
ncbi:CRISPR-associated helicase Cas3' [Cryobacterium sp. TMS1-13-1]|uniref:CRISPR-associated helicase Cas3' n=1 Tax=Cryobacterium sp. TMS1-13-1 TaxID=1259220 RepID=UPI00106AF3B6|nr:CRISPR-associated helicase Cas3' [Cryobacterium sp. TMS1-13-1]TFD21300.1 CRISPR-associated helicase Cas3' [Cryobacterium sp. TMS1-13-1]